MFNQTKITLWSKYCPEVRPIAVNGTDSKVCVHLAAQAYACLLVSKCSMELSPLNTYSIEDPKVFIVSNGAYSHEGGI